jgi:hypothetical protein
VKLILLLIGAAVPAAAVVAPAHAANDPSAAAGGAQITVVQALPGDEVDVAVDGRSVGRRTRVGSLLGPLVLSPGRHVLIFSRSSGSPAITTRLSLRPGSSSDVVLHRPASVDGAPVVNTYDTPRTPIGPEKARILLAHTATVAPADVELDGKVVFTDIANGEFADADVPAGRHRVALLPTGATTQPILGPLAVDLAPRTATMVYAVGTPRNGSMNVISHTVHLSSDGSVTPRSINTGSAGIAAGFHVTPFTSSPSPGAPPARAPRSPRGHSEGWLLAGGLGALLTTAWTSRRRWWLPVRQ